MRRVLEDKISLIVDLIGEAIPLSLARNGAIVILSARSKEKLKNLSDLMNQEDSTSFYKATDVTKKVDVQHELTHPLTVHK